MLAQRILVGLVAALAVFGVGFVSGAWVRDSIALKVQQAAAQSAAAEIAKIKVQSTVVSQKVVEHIKTEKVYADCQHSPDAYKALLEAYQ